MDLQATLQNFLNTISGYLPGVIGAIVILIIGWIFAGFIKNLVYKVLHKTDLDNKVFGATSQSPSFSPEKLISKLVYYLIMTMVLLVVLEKLGVNQVLDPLKNMLNEFFDFVPNLLAAGIIGFVGYIIATIVSELVSVAAGFLNRVAEMLGMGNGASLINIVKKLVFIIVFFPILITALDALQLSVITDPAKEMLGQFFNAIPNVIVAVIIISLFFFFGRYLTALLRELLRSMNVDNMSEKIGISSIVGGQSLSSVISNVIFFFLMFVGVITGIEKLGFGQLTDILNNMLELSGSIAFGIVILLIGNFLANIAYKALSSGKDGAFMASIARVAILGMFLAISLSTMGIANSIVELAFGLTLGAVAVAVALSYGLGGREAAGEHMKSILGRFTKK